MSARGHLEFFAFRLVRQVQLLGAHRTLKHLFAFGHSLDQMEREQGEHIFAMVCRVSDVGQLLFELEQDFPIFDTFSLLLEIVSPCRLFAVVEGTLVDIAWTKLSSSSLTFA